MKKPDLYFKLELKTQKGYKAILINENSSIKRTVNGKKEVVKAKDLKINDKILEGYIIVRILKTSFPFEINLKKSQYYEIPSFLEVIDRLEGKYPEEPWDLNSEFSKKLFEDFMILEVEKSFLGATFTDCICIDYYSSGSLCKGHYMNSKDMDLSVLKKFDIK